MRYAAELPDGALKRCLEVAGPRANEDIAPTADGDADTVQCTDTRRVARNVPEQVLVPKLLRDR